LVISSGRAVPAARAIAKYRSSGERPRPAKRRGIAPTITAVSSTWS
jgi:hypothetical protein